MPTIDEDHAQSQLELALRVAAALDQLGEPLAVDPLVAVHRHADAARFVEAASAALALLEPRVILRVSVSPEARVSVRGTLTRVPLVQGGWRLYLVRIDNPATVPGVLRDSSPSAVPAHGIDPAEAGMMHGRGVVPTTPGDVARRWLDMAVQDLAPLPARLEPVPVDYKILALYARDPGPRSAALALDIGPGTSDLASRDRVTLHFDVQPARRVELEVRDHDGRPVTCSWLVTDASGRVLPAQARRSPPDFFFQRKVYRADSEVLWLPPGDYQVLTARGPEYLVERSLRRVPAGGSVRWSVHLRRWIDPGARGWISGDHHVHAAGCSHYEQPDEGVTPAMLMPQVQGEALGIAAALTWAPGFYTQKLHFSGADDPVSTAQNRLHYDLEVSGFPSSHCGHLVLLQMKAMDYPGTTRIQQWPSSNAPVLQWARTQGAVAGYAHAGVGLWAGTTQLPNLVMPPFDGIGANDYIVTLPEGLVDFIGVCNHPPTAELNIWYHTLNVGLRSTIAGETDWPCFFEESIGMGRSYVRLPVARDGAPDYAAWCQGLRAGRSYVSDGRTHLMDFQARTEGASAEVGGEVALDAPCAMSISVDFAARLEPEPTAETEALCRSGPLDKPYWHLERARVGATRRVPVDLVVNGSVRESREVEADGRIQALTFRFTPEGSCWVALRVLGAAHTNPIWITVGGATVRVAASARWCRAAVDQCWLRKHVRIRPAERIREAALYERARAFYDRTVQETPR